MKFGVKDRTDDYRTVATRLQTYLRIRHAS